MVGVRITMGPGEGDEDEEEYNAVDVGW